MYKTQYPNPIIGTVLLQRMKRNHKFATIKFAEDNHLQFEVLHCPLKLVLIQVKITTSLFKLRYIADRENVTLFTGSSRFFNTKFYLEACIICKRQNCDKKAKKK